MALELVLTSKRLFVSDIHQGNVGSQDMVPQAIALSSKLHLIGGGPDWPPKCVRVKITSPMGTGSGVATYG